MNNNLYQDKYRISSTRVEWHDYNGEMYFVTLCTKNREHYFGEIVGKKMQLSAIGIFAQESIQQIPKHNPYAEVPLWVIMPNHIHAMVIIDAGKCGDAPLAGNCRDVPWRVSTEGKNIEMQRIANKQGRLSTVIGGFKQSVTRYAKANDLPFAWQSRFHDHIIRNNDDMNIIAEYIENNVAKWEYDKFFG